MKVTLLRFDPDALDMLLYTKESRLSGDPRGMEVIAGWSDEEKQKQLDYMRGTIQSSWEFVDYTFAVQGVSRAFTHQFVRTRTGSYAQQSQRTVDMEGFEFVHPDYPDGYTAAKGGELLAHIDTFYREATASGMPNGDARAFLPTNVATNIVGKFSLRTLADMGKVRLCYRTQGEYQDVFRAMREEVIRVHPWAEPFIRVHCAAVGTCAFPHYTECPIKGPVYNADTGLRWDEATENVNETDGLYDFHIPRQPNTREAQQALWQISPRHVANPSVKK